MANKLTPYKKLSMFDNKEKYLKEVQRLKEDGKEVIRNDFKLIILYR